MQAFSNLKKALIPEVKVGTVENYSCYPVRWKQYSYDKNIWIGFIQWPSGEELAYYVHKVVIE